MDDKKKIEELEAQVSDLKGIVHELVDKGGHRHKADGVERHLPDQIEDLISSVWGIDIQKNVDWALHGEEGETIEEHIGGVWLNRIAVVLIMTAIVIGAGITASSEELLPSVKLGLGYTLSLIALVYGLIPTKNRNIFQETSLGAGLAGIYFNSYALFFVPKMQLLAGYQYAVPLLALAMVIVSAIAYWRKIQGAASILLILITYTVVASFQNAPKAENMPYLLTTCCLVSIISLLFLAKYRWITFSWIAVVSIYTTYFIFIRSISPGYTLLGIDKFRILNAYLILSYLIFSFAFVLGERKSKSLSRSILILTVLNTLVFLTLIRPSLSFFTFENLWMLRISFALTMGVLALLSNFMGKRANVLCQVFIAKCVIILLPAIQDALPHQWKIFSLTLYCLVFATFYGIARVMIYKHLNLLVLLAAFVTCVLSVRSTDIFSIASIVVPLSWFNSVAMSVVLFVIAWYYEKHIDHPQRCPNGPVPLKTSVKTLVDIHNSTMSLMHSTAAALILLTTTIMQLGDHPQLPYILAIESVVVATLGFLFRTPQIELGSVLLLVAAHVCYHIFRVLGMNDTFTTQANYVTFTALLAIFTYFGAYLWEKYLRRIESGKEWEHHIIAGIPYIAATFMLATLITDEIPPVFSPLVQNLLGAGLLAYGCYRNYTCVKVSGITALAAGSYTYLSGIGYSGSGIAGHQYFAYIMVGVICTFVVAERCFTLSKDKIHDLPILDQSFRKVCILTGASFGMYGLYHWPHAGYLTFYWLSFGLCGLVLGAFFRESWYRWAGLAILAVTVIRAFYHDLVGLSPHYQFLLFAALGSILLITSSLYSRHKEENQNEPKNDLDQSVRNNHDNLVQEETSPE